MRRDELNEMLAATPATRNQVGAIIGEFNRLGFYGHPRDRDERLAVCAALLGIEHLRSTRDLTMGEAGQLVRLLTDTRDRGDLPAVDLTPSAAHGDDHQGDEDNAHGNHGGITLADVLKRLAVIIAGGMYREPTNDSPAD